MIAGSTTAILPSLAFVSVPDDHYDLIGMIMISFHDEDDNQDNNDQIMTQDLDDGWSSERSLQVSRHTKWSLLMSFFWNIWWSSCYISQHMY